MEFVDTAKGLPAEINNFNKPEFLRRSQPTKEGTVLLSALVKTQLVEPPIPSAATYHRGHTHETNIFVTGSS